jgi:hypothetical protein
VGLAGLFLLFGCGPPQYLSEGRPEEVVCLDGDQVTGVLQLTASEGGRRLAVAHEGRVYRLSYRRSRRVSAEYSGNGATVSIDPEVFFTSSDGVRLGPCG